MNHVRTRPTPDPKPTERTRSREGTEAQLQAGRLNLNDIEGDAPRKGSPDPRKPLGLSLAVEQEMAPPALPTPDELDRILNGVRAVLSDPNAPLPGPLRDTARAVIEDELAKLEPARERVNGLVAA